MSSIISIIKPAIYELEKDTVDKLELLGYFNALNSSSIVKFKEMALSSAMFKFIMQNISQSGEIIWEDVEFPSESNEYRLDDDSTYEIKNMTIYSKDLSYVKFILIAFSKTKLRTKLQYLRVNEEVHKEVVAEAINFEYNNTSVMMIDS